MNDLTEAAHAVIRTAASAAGEMLTPLGLVELIYVALSIVGQEFIARRDRRGFYAWGVSNIFGAIMFIALQRWMALVLAIYFCTKNVQGLRTWKRLEEAGASASLSARQRESSGLEGASPARS